ncbi:MAG: hypothetical protein AAFN74_26910, partial [Myxococcota bacterium]
MRRMPTSGSSIPVCAVCGGLATPLVRPKKIRGFVEALPQFVASFFTMDGLTSLAALGIFVYLLKTFGVGIFAWAVTTTYMFTVIQSAAQGSERLPDPTDFTDVFSIVLPVMRFIVALSYVWLPAVLYVTFGFGGLGLEDPPLYSDPLFILLNIAGLAYFPMAVIVAAISESFIAVLDPRLGVRIISRIPNQYVGATMVALGILLCGQVFEFIADFVVALLPIPIIPGLLAETVATTFWLAAGWILGRLLYQNHEHFGLVLQGDDVELEWPDAVPRAPTAPEGSQSKQPVEAAPVEGWTSREEGLSRAAETIASVPENARIVEAPRREVAPLEIEGWTDRAGPATAGGGQLPVMRTSDLQNSQSPQAPSTKEAIELDLDGDDGALPLVSALEASSLSSSSGPYSKVPTPADAPLGVPIITGTPDIPAVDGPATEVAPMMLMGRALPSSQVPATPSTSPELESTTGRFRVPSP